MRKFFLKMHFNLHNKFCYRVCKNKVSDHLILEHMKNHIKYCADNDKKSHSSNLGKRYEFNT